MFWFFFLFSGLCAGIPLLTKPLFYKYCKLIHLTLYRKKNYLLFLPLVAVMVGEMQMEWIERKKLLKLYIICSQWFQNICLESRSKSTPYLFSVQTLYTVLYTFPSTKITFKMHHGFFFYKARSVVALQCNLCNKSRSFKWQKIKTTDILKKNVLFLGFNQEL